MPISFRVDRDSGVVIATCSGVLGLEDGREAAAELWTVPGWKGEAALWDFRSAELDFDLSQIEALAQFILANQPASPPARMAFVTERDLDFGLTRMFDGFRRDDRTALRVLRDFDEALAFCVSGVRPTDEPSSHVFDEGGAE